MKKKRRILFWMNCITVMYILFSGQEACAQKDSITYNSTCTNYKIQFNSSIFNTMEFPDKISWNFGDPSSGYYNNASIQQPLHAFSSPGLYTITLTVFNGGDSVTLSD